MKRIFLAALIAAVTLTVYSCKKDNSVKPNQTSGKTIASRQMLSAPPDTLGGGDQGGPKGPPQ
jgi:hypothetical protein